MPQASVQAPANPQDTLRDMQASLGPAKYKKLKRFTREFAEGELESDAYIDHAASLFDRGYRDPDFWKTMPLLVASCPHQASANEALQYMESLRTKAPAPSATPVSLVPQTNNSNSWGTTAAPLDLTPQSFPTPPFASGRPGPTATTGRGNNWGGAAAAPGRGTPTTRYVLPSGKKKGAWGNGVVAGPNIKQAATRATPISVASAAANQEPQGGTATKFMAKQTKQQKTAQITNQNKKKKKEKEELRNLAFGR